MSVDQLTALLCTLQLEEADHERPLIVVKSKGGFGECSHEPAEQLMRTFCERRGIHRQCSP